VPQREDLERALALANETERKLAVAALIDQLAQRSAMRRGETVQS